MKVTFQGEPGEGSGVLRSLFTAVSEVRLIISTTVITALSASQDLQKKQVYVGYEEMSSILILSPQSTFLWLAVWNNGNWE